MPRPPKTPRPFHGSPFLRLSAIQRTMAPKSRELDQLEKLVSQLELSQRWRATSGVDLEPYSLLLRTHLQSLRSSPPARPDGTFLRSALHLVRLLESLGSDPFTAREPVAGRAKTA